MALPYNAMSKVHEHQAKATPLPDKLKHGMPEMHNANTSAHLSQKAMPVHYTPGIDPLTTEYRAPNVTPTGAIEYPQGGDVRR